MSAVPQPQCRWRAQWLWAQNAANGQNPLVYARRVFELDGAPKTARLFITADTYYRLHINGRQVGRGPARSQVFWMSYDGYDVAGLLERGRNVIAVEVNGFFETSGGLLCQLEVDRGADREPLLVCSDESWRVLPAPGWGIDTAGTSFWDRSEVFDGDREPAGWKTADFAADGWLPPLVRGPALTAPYFQLEPRDIPFLDEREVRAVAVVETGEEEEMQASTDPWDCRDVALKMLMDAHLPPRDCRVLDAERLTQADAGPAVVEHDIGYHDTAAYHDTLDNTDRVPTTRSAFVVLDFGRLLNGYFELDVEGAAGDVVDIAYGQELTADGRVAFFPYLERKWGSCADRYVLRDGRQGWQSFYWKNARYVQLTFRRLDKPLTLHGFRIREINHACEERGRFACSDDHLNRLWQATTTTTRLCFTDSYMDNPFREKAIWSGDVSVIILAAFAAFGDIPGTQRYLRFFSRGQSYSGFFPSNMRMYPGNSEGRIYIYHNMQYALRVGEYFWYGGNRALVDELYPAIRKFVTWLAGYRNERGLLENVPMIQWIDWANNDLRGEVMVYNALFYGILRYAADMARACGRPGEAADMTAMADAIAEAAPRRFWNEERGLYVDCVVDGQPSDRLSEHTNYTALLFDMADDARRARILAALDEPARDIVQVEPSYMLIPMQALFHVGESRRALQFMRRRYRRIFKTGSDVLWEEWSYRASLRRGVWWARWRSMAQGAGCCPSYVLSTEVLGVKPAAPGFTSFTVRPQWGDLEWAEGVVPAPTGDIAVSWRFADGDYRLSVDVPEATTAQIFLPSDGEETVRTVGPGRHEFNVAGVRS